MRADERNARRIVRERSNGDCEVRLPDCEGRATDWQHRKNRSQGGRWTPSNGIHACRSCHAWIHANPTNSYRKGWMVHSYNDPADVPVLLWLGLTTGWVRLDDEGGMPATFTDTERITEAICLPFGVDPGSV